MTAEIIILPVIRRFNPASEAPCATKVPYEIDLDFETAGKIEDAAALANTTPEKMLEGLILWGLAQMNEMNDDEFSKSQKIAAIAEKKY